MSRSPASTKAHAAASLGKISVLVQGYEPGFLRQVLERHGARAALKNMAAVAGVVAQCESAFGVRDGHIVLGFASLWNGCEYCTVGHLRAGVLQHYGTTRGVFALDERTVRELSSQSDGRILEYVRGALTHRHERLLALLLRQYDLRRRRGLGTSDDDALLRRANTVFEWLGEAVGRQGALETPASVPPLSKLAKQKALVYEFETIRPTAVVPTRLAQVAGIASELVDSDG